MCEFKSYESKHSIDTYIGQVNCCAKDSMNTNQSDKKHKHFKSHHLKWTYKKMTVESAVNDIFDCLQSTV